MPDQAHTCTGPSDGGTCFFTLVGTPQQARHARLLIDSLHAFGGRLSDCTVWVLYHSQDGSKPSLLTDPLRDLKGVHLTPLEMGTEVRYWFAAKVHACAQAEEIARSGVRSLVWLAPESLILRSPVLFDLGASHPASSKDTSYVALRTVHHSNIGSPARQPLDPFWAAVYRSVGLAEAPYTTCSFADSCELRPYWNTHCFSVDPAMGLLHAWREGFLAMVADQGFQSGPCQDVPHRVFLHQAVLCALLTKELAQAQIRALPPEYSYPLHMHDQVPGTRRARALNNLVCAVYEDDLSLESIAVHEPLRSWLIEHVPTKE
jgi:hypothetical protein